MTDQQDIAERAQLKVGAHVLIQLGRELVTDPEQALLELVKNAYDADSPRCEIIVDTRKTGVIEQEGTRAQFASFQHDTPSVKISIHELENDSAIDDPPVRRRLEYTGEIIVRDRGIGLSEKAVKDSWLVVSNSIKRVERGKPKPLTEMGRTPLGDKGLGRLGTMRLGDILYLRSAQKDSKVVNVAWFRWADCDGAKTLDRIPVEVSTEPNDEGFVGTEVIIRGLNDISEWRNESRTRQLSYSIATIVSPFEAVGTFPVLVRIDGLGYDLDRVTNDLLKEAASSFSFRYEVDEAGDGRLHATARFRRAIFTASNKLRSVEEEQYPEQREENSQMGRLRRR